MATTEELLGINEVVDRTLTVDMEARTITIPETVTHIGVENDKDVLSFDFKMARIYDDVDLSTFDIRINYLNANNEGANYEPENVTITDDTIEFEWLVSRFAVVRRGHVTFNVCCREINEEDATVIREFNTTVATLPVLPGLEVDEFYEEAYTDFIAKCESLFATQFVEYKNAMEASTTRYNEQLNELTANLTNLQNDIETNVHADLLETLGGRISQVGDVKETTRTDIGAGWALCNGDPFVDTDYPNLAAVTPYSMEFHTIPVSGTDYKIIKPAASERYWMLKDKVRNATKVAIYDAYTGELTVLTNPAEAEGKGSVYIVGVYHDGDRWVMCVQNRTSSAKYEVYIYTATDLTTWTLAYTPMNFGTASGWYAYDFIFDGVTYDILVSNEESYRVYFVKKDFSSNTYSSLFDDTTNNSESYELVACPNNHWMGRLRDGASTTEDVTLRIGGTTGYITAGYTSSNNDKLNCLEFFNDQYAFQVGHNSSVDTCDIYVLDLINNTHLENSIDVSNIASSAGYSVSSSADLAGMMYDAGENEWIMYISSYATSTGTTYYAARISAESDPTVASSYTVEQIDTIPDILPVGQSSIGRGHAHIDGEKIHLFCPMVKYLPEHSGDTYKYINIGVGDNGGTGGDSSNVDSLLEEYY